MSECKYCGKNLKRGNICGNCSGKYKQVKKLIEIGKSIRERSGQKQPAAAETYNNKND